MSETHSFQVNESVTIKRGKNRTKRATIVSISGQDMALKLDEDGALIVTNAENLKAPDVPVINQTRLAEIFSTAITSGERSVDQVAHRLDDIFPGFSASLPAVAASQDQA